MATNSYLPLLFFSAALCLYSLSGSRLLAQRQPLASSTAQADSLRQQLLTVARGEIGVRETRGRNDGPRIAEYLSYCGLGEGHDWCAAFASWCFGQIGRDQPRNPWSAALFPRSRRLSRTDQALPGDVFGLYSASLGRIHHVGLVEKLESSGMLLTIEGNSHDRVERRRRPMATIARVSDWIGKEGR